MNNRLPVSNKLVDILELVKLHYKQLDTQHNQPEIHTALVQAMLETDNMDCIWYQQSSYIVWIIINPGVPLKIVKRLTENLKSNNIDATSQNYVANFSVYLLTPINF